MSRKRIALALTGASGAIYFLRLLERLEAHPEVELELVASDGGKRVLWEESKIRWRDIIEPRRLPVHAEKDIGATLASGSNRLDHLVIVPASMNTVAMIAHGMAGNLIHRAAAVQLKERRGLIVVPRETPLSLINLRAMTTLAEAGALVMPAMPGFYQNPESVQELADTVVDRIIDHLGVDDSDVKRWAPCSSP